MACLLKLNYRIKNTQGKESVVHVNRMKRAYKQRTLTAKEKGRCYRKHRARGQELEEDEPAVLAPGPISIPAPQVDNRQPGPRSPKRNSPRGFDTPATDPHHLDTPGSQCADPTYASSQIRPCPDVNSRPRGRDHPSPIYVLDYRNFKRHPARNTTNRGAAK